MQHQIPTTGYQTHAKDVDSTSTKPPCTVPRLRKNRKIENRWGSQYQIAAQFAVLGRQCYPYVPTERPASLSEEIVESEPLYVCKYCKDCFRFQSSFKDHNERRSWIFGLWCHGCFSTKCTHATKKGSICLTCLKEDNEKCAYLRDRGLTNKSYFNKLGAVKVFYNQCQLLEHMKLHNMISVDMQDLMLMPLPSDLCSSDWSVKLELVCEALMEHTFLSRVHIMDWLRINNVEHNWWKLIDGDDNLICRMVTGYRGREVFKTHEISADSQFLDSTDSIDNNKSSPEIEFTDTGFNDKDTADGHSNNVCSDKSMSENEDNPCMSTDIAFVDCGPTPKCFESESSMSYVAKNQATPEIQDTLHHWRSTDNETNKKRNSKSKNLETDTSHENTTTKVSEKHRNLVKQSSKNSAQHYKVIEPFLNKGAGNSINRSIIQTNIGTILQNPVKINLPVGGKKITFCETNSNQSLQPSLINCNSKIFTIQGSKSVNVASILNISPFISNKNNKVVFFGKDSPNVVTLCNKNETTAEKLNKPLNSGSKNIKILPKTCKPIVVQKLQEQQLPGKIVIKDGKRFLIKHAESITKDSECSSNLPVVNVVSKAVQQLTTDNNTSTSMSTSTGEDVDMEQTISSHNDISMLTPSPSPSELSSGSSCESHVKQTLTKFRKAPPRLISLDLEKLVQKNVFEIISLIKEENGDTYINVRLEENARKEISLDMYEVLPKCRREMINGFYQLNSFELKKRIDHLQHVSEEMWKAMNFISDHVIKEKLRSISNLQQILGDCFHKSNQDHQVNDQMTDDAILNEWELTNVNVNDKCPSCKKIKKPKSYIAGFSKLPKNDNIYCTCYKYVCHECRSYYGTLSRFIAHQNLHKKVKPYSCPDCCCKFASDKSLEIHIWTVCYHTLKKHLFACKICEIDGFKDIESITRHFAVMHSITKVACENCYKVFPSYHEYVKHYTETHPMIAYNKLNPIRLAICRLDDKIVRYENYMSFLDNCPGIRKSTWFKCPFCRLVTPENENMKIIINTHLRQSHPNILSRIISQEAQNCIFGTKILKTGTSGDFANTPTNATVREEAATVPKIPKIVNTRTIPSEVFERGSQDTDDTWTVNSDRAASTITVNVNLQATEKVVNKEKLNMLPKILDVRSIADLKTTESTVKKTLTKTRGKFILKPLKLKPDVENNSNSSHNDAIKTTKLNDSKFNSKGEVKRMKQSDKGNNESSDQLLHSNTVPQTSTESCIKVIDVRTIYEPNNELAVPIKSCDTQEIEDNGTSSVPKPPPLVKIPQHLYKLGEAANDGSTSVERSEIFAEKVIVEPKPRISINESMQEDCVEFLCHLCGERINTSWSVVQMHFSQKHSEECKLAVITPRLLRLSSDFIKSGYKQIIVGKKRKSDFAVFASKRKRRWTPKKHTEIKDSSTSDIGLCVEQESAEDGEGNYKCKKCDQRCTDMSDLREHIATNHKLKGRYLICLECGENFVVAPSLQMHLKAFHGIEDPVSYMNQNPSYASATNNDLETEGKTTVANQCYVCMAVFEDKAAVDKHLRVHGMAFLNRKMIEARNAQKSPEKRANVENDKQSPVKEHSKNSLEQDKPAETVQMKSDKKERVATIINIDMSTENANMLNPVES